VAWSADYEATITPDLWGLIKKRHGQLMAKFLTWPGPVVLISRERVATVFEGGQPTSKKDWTLECKKDLPSQVTAWVRLEGGGVARVVKLRSAKASVSVMPDQDRARKVSDFSLATLIFDWVGCEVGVSRAARMNVLDADQDMPDEVTEVQPAGSGQEGRPSAPLRAVPNEEQLRQIKEQAQRGVGLLMSYGGVDAARKLRDIAAKDPSGKVDVLDDLNQDRRDVLGIKPDVTALTLAQLADAVVGYLEKPGRRSVDDTVAGPEDPEQSAMDLLGGELGATPVDQAAS
jgi:hypothetical protein